MRFHFDKDLGRDQSPALQLILMLSQYIENPSSLRETFGSYFLNRIYFFHRTDYGRDRFF